MKPYLLVSGDFAKSGGMDRANYALASYLARSGRPVHLVAHRASDDLLELPGVFFHRVPKLANSYLVSGPLLDLTGRYWAREITRQGGHVLVNGGNCRWNDVNWVHHVHAADRPWLQGNSLRRMKVRLSYSLARSEERRRLPEARLVITTCERTRQDIIQLLHIPAEKVVYVYMGVDSELFHPLDESRRDQVRSQMKWTTGRPVLIFVGALGDGRKGFDTLFNAWKTLCQDTQWDGHLAVVGRGPNVPMWKQRVEEAGIGSRIEFLGFVRDLPAVLGACDALVLPSRYEGYSLVAQEALACGIPALITRTAGIAERYPSDLQSLLLDNPEDSSALVKQLRIWRSDVELYRKKVAPLSELLRQNSWDNMAKSMADMIERR